MDTATCRDYFAATGGLGTLATCSVSGAPNVAMFGSAQLVDESHIAIALGDNRTLRNLSENPRAVFAIAIPGPSVVQWRGVRLYLELERLDTEGELFLRMRDRVSLQAGRGAARRIRTAALFRIESRRPLLDPAS